ncbi:hypothetical protein H7F51_13150 [Novosphingobium flavum]|uniref:Fe-S oxidoreductase n=1 Tax=Novosphingobium flavum TaxID=1778672 RepID=A0A7X1FT25_9SPHN|nr:hypothetical protein [Novosphingobium flavum]MBC2666469.1 hypothetical protein [Novosphingobium flavum]
MTRFVTPGALALAFSAGALGAASLASAQSVEVPADAAPAGTIPESTPTVVDNTLPPPPAAAENKVYPVCTKALTDNCQNPGEGGAPGRSRAGNMKRHAS